MKTRFFIIIGITILGIGLFSVTNNGHDLFHYLNLPYEWHDSFGFTDRNIIRSTQCASEELGWLEPCNDVQVIPENIVDKTKMINDTITIPSAQEFLQMACEDLNHLYPEFPSEEVADAWITRMHECINEQENTKQELEDFCAWSFPKIEHELYYADCMKGHLAGVNQWVQNQEN